MVEKNNPDDAPCIKKKTKRSEGNPKARYLSFLFIILYLV